MDYGPQAPMNTTTVATAVQRIWASHTYTRCYLLLLMGGSIVTSCSVHVLLSTCGVCPGLCAREREQQKQKNFYRYVREKSASYRETREIVLSTPVGKKLRARHASYSARIELKPRPQVPDGLPMSTYLAFWLKVVVRRDNFENRRKFH